MASKSPSSSGSSTPEPTVKKIDPMTWEYDQEAVLRTLYPRGLAVHDTTGSLVLSSVPATTTAATPAAFGAAGRVGHVQAGNAADRPQRGFP